MPRDTFFAPVILPPACSSGGSRTSTASTLPSAINHCALLRAILGTAAFAAASRSVTEVGTRSSPAGSCGRVEDFALHGRSGSTRCGLPARTLPDHRVEPKFVQERRPQAVQPGKHGYGEAWRDGEPASRDAAHDLELMWRPRLA